MNPLVQLRRRQIDGLLTVPNTTTRDNIAFDILINSILLHIDLPADFPLSPPVCVVRPFIQHHMVRDGLVVHDKLVNWNQHTSLEKIVRELVDIFKQVPPPVPDKQPSAPYTPQRPLTVDPYTLQQPMHYQYNQPLQYQPQLQHQVQLRQYNQSQYHIQPPQPQQPPGR